MAVSDYEKEIDHLSALYNGNKALLDQHSLGTDLQELHEYVSPYPPVVLVDLTICRILRELKSSLLSMYPDSGKRKIFKELWNAGEVRDKIRTGNARIRSIRNRWQVRGSSNGLNAESC